VLARLTVVIAALLSSVAGARPCTTMALYQAARQGTPLLDVGFGERPTDIRATFDSAVPGHALRIHAGDGVDDARALAVLETFDAVWVQQVETAGFPPPLTDGVGGGDERLDVYVVPLSPGLAGVTIATGDEDANDGRRASPAFIEMDPTLPDDLLAVFAAHEFQHALQFALDTEEPVMWFESTAVFWEVRTDPDVTEWTLPVPDCQGSPQVPIFVDGPTAEALSERPALRYEYGAVLFALYLDEVHGDGAGTLLREIWQGTPQSDDVNEPDFIDALAAVPSVALDPGELVADFATWRTLVGPLSVDGDGPLEDVPATGGLFAIQLNAATLDGDAVATDEGDGPYALGCAVRQVLAPANIEAMPVEIRVQSTLDDQLVRLAILVIEPDAPAPVVRRETAAAATHLEQVSVPRGHLLQLAVCDVSPADPDDDPVVRPVSLSILRTDVDFPDAGTPEPDAGTPVDGGVDVPLEPACGCQSTPRHPRGNRGLGFSALGVLATLLVFAVRAVRQQRRGRTMTSRKK
jgi:hypothetical protein